MNLAASTIERGGLVVIEHALEPSLVQAMRTDAQLLMERGIGYRVTSSRYSPGAVETTYAHAQHVLGMDGIGEFVRMSLRDDEIPGGSVAVNRQQPASFQRFHPDSKLHSVANAYLDPDGAFDYTGALFDWNHPDIELDSFDEPDVLPDAFDTVLASAGDVVVQMHPWKTHRGRNAGLAVRYNVAVYTN
jgi:hypothetical protein